MNPEGSMLILNVWWSYGWFYIYMTFCKSRKLGVFGIVGRKVNSLIVGKSQYNLKLIKAKFHRSPTYLIHCFLSKRYELERVTELFCIGMDWKVIVLLMPSRDLKMSKFIHSLCKLEAFSYLIVEKHTKPYWSVTVGFIVSSTLLKF